MEATAAVSKRETILAHLAGFVAQRPGIDPRNYISGWNDAAGRAAYRSESREVTKDRHTFDKLLSAVRWRESIGEAELREAFRAYSGRLTIEDRADGSIRLDYCTGQYFATEYRKAACAVLASALWDYTRENCPNAERLAELRVSAGDWIRSTLRREFGRTIANRYFN